MNVRSAIRNGYNVTGHGELAVPQTLFLAGFLLVTDFNREKVAVHD
tara:strand:- start:386 stop:523 length:138 start_codon:yes stop_codon:yes gene_type:complete